LPTSFAALPVLQSKTKGNVMQFFLWLIFNVLLATAVWLCVVVGFLEAFQTTAQLCRKVVCSDFLFCYKADGRSFLSQIISGGMKHESVTWNCRQKDSH
jgi:hypothetical protein